eukprot:CAMPEP_0203668176 /NCGR_PEP_ID=MMETSP0090-20130426/4871_1 /ASSEMBLY_ACC=CAM_ASM_001088 /TAXON_ID=426623 /ORGANISM="Chaetoceros affinis, Strain CCMP159" /LENGTH=137 /DNA_ID=CAMNT_0050532543 /DNA_START=138 /DNA_END=547 /DNA_ORIENTATION=+
MAETSTTTTRSSKYQSLPDATLNSNLQENNGNGKNSHLLRGNKTNANGNGNSNGNTNSGATNNANNTRYKGFNTSITHIFTDPQSSRIDCCSLACCGLLQSDYNRYILHNRRPPTFRNRFVQYILIPIVFFCIAGYS